MIKVKQSTFAVSYGAYEYITWYSGVYDMHTQGYAGGLKNENKNKKTQGDHRKQVRQT